MNENVLQAIAKVRETGQTNMFSKSNVQKIAASLGYQEEATKIRKMDSAEYMKHLQNSV